MELFERISRAVPFHISWDMGYAGRHDNTTGKEPDMATREVLVDDLDGSAQDVQTVHLEVSGTSYAIDLGPSNREALVHALQPYLQSARTGRKARAAAVKSGSNGHSPQDVAAVRAWARSNGYDVGDRGRVPRTVWDAYAAR